MNRKKIEKIKTELETINKENLNEIDKLNTTTTSLFAISLAILTIQISILNGTIFNIFQKYITTKYKYMTICIILLLLTDITPNLYSIFNFRQSLNLSKEKFKDEKIIYQYMNNEVRKDSYIKMTIEDIQSSINVNYNVISLKKEYIRIGLNCILVSIILLIASIIISYLIQLM